MQTPAALTLSTFHTHNLRRGLQTQFPGYANQRRKYGADKECEPSRFLAKLPAADLQYEDGRQPASTEERRQHGRWYPDHIRNLLAQS